MAKLAASVGGGWSILDWILDPQHNSVVGAIGLGMSIFGTVVTLTGFGITIYQLMKTQSAAKAATEAVESLKIRVAAYNAAFEVSRASTALKEIQKNLKSNQWGVVSENYGIARESLIRISEMLNGTNGYSSEKLESIIVEINEICILIDSKVMKDHLVVDPTKVMMSLNSQYDFVVRLGIHIERMI